MAKQRSELSAVLHEICDNVYFQPPTGKIIDYPCIVYKLEKMDVLHADNAMYTHHDKYEIKYITRDPDDIAKYEFLRIPYCVSENMYIADNLYHYPFTVFI